MRDALVVLGCGWIARRHATAARRIGMPVIFASRDESRARAYAREFAGIAAYGSYDAALGDPRALAALVCTPHDRHVADAVAAFDRGRHVRREADRAFACRGGSDHRRGAKPRARADGRRELPLHARVPPRPSAVG